MSGAGLTEALLALNASGVVIVLAALGFLARRLKTLRDDELRPTRRKVERLESSHYETGDGRAGVHQRLDEIEAEMEEDAETANAAHREILGFLRVLTRRLRSEGVDVPVADDEVEEERLFRGGRDDD